MRRLNMRNNPFKITTPEDLTATETVSLFVDVFTDFSQITDPGHVMLKGPRGVGKSMMFRYLQPDCQCLSKNTTIDNLPYIAIYIPLKNTNFSLTELRRFDDNHASEILNEHLMISHCILKVFESLRDTSLLDNEKFYSKIMDFYTKFFTSILDVDNEYVASDHRTCEELFALMVAQINTVYRETISYIKKSAFTNGILPYSGPLYDYNDYLIPLLEELSKAISKESVTFYLLLDDAHFLSDKQTRILNTWVSSRTSRKVSLKISTQYNYKSYYTVNGATIDTPHDYIEIDMATVYTERNKNSKSTYYRRIKDIVDKRLQLCGVDIPAEKYFISDINQENKIKEIEEYYNKRFDEGNGRGHNRTDDAKRYARPDYIKSLSGTSKSSYTYSYSGFEQLVNISSGIVRYFLQQAHTMYAKVASQQEDSEIKCIPPSIQSMVVREYANEALFDDLEAYKKDEEADGYPKEDIEKLINLITGLGGLFRKILLSERSERRIFSVAISDNPSNDVLRIIDIGIQLGYFHKSTIGRKNSGSIGRTNLYVLNRRLAPIWNLDPNGFAGYLFVKNCLIEKAINEPIRMIEDFDKKKQQEDSMQLSLFELEPEILVESEEGEDD